MNPARFLDELFPIDDEDVGCEQTFEVLDVYTELQLAGEDPSLHYPGVAAHLRSCPACRADYLGLRAAAAGEE